MNTLQQQLKQEGYKLISYYDGDDSFNVELWNKNLKYNRVFHFFIVRSDDEIVNFKNYVNALQDYMINYALATAKINEYNNGIKASKRFGQNIGFVDMNLKNEFISAHSKMVDVLQRAREPWKEMLKNTKASLASAVRALGIGYEIIYEDEQGYED